MLWNGMGSTARATDHALLEMGGAGYLGTGQWSSGITNLGMCARIRLPSRRGATSMPAKSA